MVDSRHRFSLLLVLACIGIESLPVLGRAQQQSDEEEPFLPGLSANYRDDHGHTASRLDYQLAFHWGELPPDPRLTPGEFRTTWQGNLLTAPRGNYRFFVFGSGEVELKIGGRVVVPRQVVRNGWLASQSLTLSAEYHPLHVSFRRTEKDARLMLLWSGPDFAMEPIPSRFLYHPREKPVERDFERGRLLARVLRCGRCHGEEQVPSAPALDRLCGNISRDWLVRWLTDNERARQGALAAADAGVWPLRNAGRSDCRLVIDAERSGTARRAAGRAFPRGTRGRGRTVVRFAGMFGVPQLVRSRRERVARRRRFNAHWG